MHKITLSKNLNIPNMIDLKIINQYELNTLILFFLLILLTKIYCKWQIPISEKILKLEKKGYLKKSLF